MEELLQWFSPEHIIEVGGILLVAAIIFIESGIFFGFFLPGDSLLFSAGLFCGTAFIKIPILHVVLLLMLMSFLGYLVGYFTGKWFVRSRIYIDEKYFFRQKYIMRSGAFFRKYKGPAFILARFVPLIRTFLPILAGSIKIEMKFFLMYNFFGSLIWVNLIVLTGFYVGRFNPAMLYHLEWVIMGLIIVTTLPVIKILFGKKILSWKRKRNRQVL